MIAVVAVLGIMGILYLAISGAMDSTQVDTGAGGMDTAPDAVKLSTPSNSTDNPDTYFTGDNVAIVAEDQDTWPGGNAIWDVARAIAVAEGYGRVGKAPTVLNNPGDISDGMNTFGSEQHSGSHVTHFPDAQTGWNWLYNKLHNIQNGKSDVYSNNMTWTTLAQKWAANWQPWVNNVTRELGVASTDRVGDYWNA